MALDPGKPETVGKCSLSRMSSEAMSRFGLAIEPFSPKHDPRFLLRSSPMRRALKALHKSVDAKANLIVVVGQAGVGKTAVVDALSREFKDGIRTARISDPTASWSEIGQEIGEQLRLTGRRLSPGAMAADQGPVRVFRVIVDQAERLGDDSVKHLGAYLDLKAGKGRQIHRLQVIMVARDDEAAPVLRWLSGRVHSRVELGPLGTGQIRQYVNRRMQIAQGAVSSVFSGGALDRIVETVGGNPNAINRLCAASLEIAASRGSNAVDAETIGAAARRLRGSSVPPSTPAAAPLASSPAVATPVPKAYANHSLASFDESLDTVSDGPRAQDLGAEGPVPGTRANAIWAGVCAVLVGVIALGAAYWHFDTPREVTHAAIQIVEIPVEKIVEVVVEKIVEVPVEVVKIVRVEVPVKPKSRPAKPRPKRIVKVETVSSPAAPPPASPMLAPKKPETRIAPQAATVLDLAFAKSQPGDHVRRVEILRHREGGTTLMQTLKLARIKRDARTLTIGVLTGDVSSNAREIENRFLSIETGRLEDERFGYRPARKEVEPLKGGRGRDPFFGSSFHYDDFRVRVANQYVIHSMDETRIGDQDFYTVSTKPRFRAVYERVEFVVDARDYALVEVHFFKGLGLRPYRIIQYPRADMKAMGEALVPMRMISRDFQTGEIDEARVVNLTLAESLDPTLFTLRRLQEEPFGLPSL